MKSNIDCIASSAISEKHSSVQHKACGVNIVLSNDKSLLFFDWNCKENVNSDNFMIFMECDY